MVLRPVKDQEPGSVAGARENGRALVGVESRGGRGLSDYIRFLWGMGRIWGFILNDIENHWGVLGR